MIESVLKYSEFTCGIILFIFAIIQVIYKNRNFLNYNLAGLYFCLSYVIMTFWAFKSGIILYAPWLLFTDMTTAFLIGPFAYFYIKTVLGIKTKSFAVYRLHFIPAVIILIVIVINNIVDGEMVRYFLHFPSAYPPYNISPLIRAIDFISNIYMIFYFLLIIKLIYSLINKNSKKSGKELYIVFYYMFFIVLFSFMMLISNTTGSSILNISAIYLLTLSGVWYFIFSFRYPEFTQKAIREAKVIRYENSLLNGVDSDVVLERLDDLMEDEKIFKDEELTMQKLSELLIITPHQFSKILNSKRKMNFRTLVNSYRIKEAMNQMAAYPDKTILEIALASGFNSKSSFNAVFMKSSGFTPSDYRKSLKNQQG
jgi:AraC-like DNA-binding protein